VGCVTGRGSAVSNRRRYCGIMEEDHAMSSLFLAALGERKLIHPYH
jgi:hypothetical protein